MTTEVKGKEARQGDRGWSLARALLIALAVGVVVLIGLELYGTYGQPDQPVTLAPTEGSSSGTQTGTSPSNGDG